VVEDISAVTKKGQKRWNKSFSPLEVGKNWFYAELGQIAPVHLYQGYETKVERDNLGLKKISNKMSDSFEAHCIDSWAIVNMYVGGHVKPDNTSMMYIVPLRFHRRQLHMFQFAKGGVRKQYGGTMSMGIKRGSWVKHPKYGVCYIGGTSNGRVSLHNMQNSKRLTQNAKPEDCKFLTYASWRIRKEISIIPPHR
jgi:hypothetical protein